VYKQSITVNLIRRGMSGRKDLDVVRTMKTTTGELRAFADWLRGEGCETVAMESTGVYWRPVFNILEADFPVLLVNARHIKTVPGRKTDVADCQWIAQLLQHGLLKASFIPPSPIRSPIA
jgi:transposase